MAFTVEFNLQAERTGSVGFEGMASGKPSAFRSLAIVGTFDLGNCTALASQLGLPVGSPPEHCIIAGYQTWGEDVLSRLQGEFAFVLWSEEKRTVFAARDRFGVHPLAYAVRCGTLALSSHQEHLSQGLLSPMWISQYLAGILSSASLTPFEGVVRLPAGAFLRADPAGHQVAPWYVIEPRRVPPKEAPDAIRAALERAVQRMSDESTATLLSGGLDSSALTLLLARQEQANIDAISMVYPDYPSLDETRFIDAVVDTEPNISGHRFPLTARDFDGDVARLLATQGQPVSVVNLATIMMAYHSAAQTGARCVLDGHGGDEVIGSGLWYLVELAQAGRYGTLLRAFRDYRKANGANATAIGLGGILVMAKSRPLARLAGAVERRRSGEQLPWRRLVAENMAQSTDLVAEANKGIGAAHEHLEGQERLHAQLCLGPHTDRSFEVLRRLAANEGLQVKFPLYDQEVVELCIGQSSHAKFGAGLTRNLIREAMRGIYPEQVRLRTSKINFSPFIFDSLKGSATVRKLREGVPDALRVFVSEQGLSDMFDDLDNDRNLGIVSSEVGRLVQLDQWLEGQPGLINHQSVTSDFKSRVCVDE